MSSTFPTSRSNQSHLINRFKEIQSKKETLKSLETALKKRVNELKELCLREGELIGQLPLDYPLQPREPLPQIRKRVHPRPNNHQHQHQHHHPQHHQHQHQHQHQQPQLQQQPATIPAGHQVRRQPVTPQPPTQPLHQHTHYDANGLAGFQPYYEETKPFQMSDFYKYSSKFRQPVVPEIPASCRTTRQLQDDVSLKNSLRFRTDDEPIHNAVKLIERSDRKLIEATAKALEGNPGLAIKLNNVSLQARKV